MEIKTKICSLVEIDEILEVEFPSLADCERMYGCDLNSLGSFSIPVSNKLSILPSSEFSLTEPLFPPSSTKSIWLRSVNRLESNSIAFFNLSGTRNRVGPVRLLGSTATHGALVSEEEGGQVTHGVPSVGVVRERTGYPRRLIRRGGDSGKTGDPRAPVLRGIRHRLWRAAADLRQPGAVTEVVMQVGGVAVVPAARVRSSETPDSAETQLESEGYPAPSRGDDACFRTT
jgi:hypothetical protein